jgi:hypothetical protein
MKTITSKHLLTVFIIILGMGLLSCNLTGNLGEQLGMGDGGGSSADFPEGNTISMEDFLREYARNQGWPEPEEDTCDEIGYPQPPGTTCLDPLGSEFETGYGMGISYFIKRDTGEGPCYIGSTASIYDYMNTSPIGEGVIETGSETYRNVAVKQYTYDEEPYSALYYRWYYEDMTFTVSEVSLGLECERYSPNTQAFQLLIDLLEEGYRLTP